MIKDKIRALLKDVLKEQGFPQEIDFAIEHPVDEKHGDYSSNIALAIFSKSKIKNQISKIQIKIQKLRNPLDLARFLVEILNTKYLIQNTAIDRAEAVAPGFINFWLARDYLFSRLEKILQQKEKFGSKNEDPSKKVVVEYSSPNIAKPFTVGHLRSTIIGDAIANLLSANGWKVFRDNHLGDWGTQFGKQIYAIKKWGNESELDKAENPIKILVDLYVKFHQEAEKDPGLEDQAREWFKKLEEGDKEAKGLWQKCVDWSLKEFQKIYQKLNVKFTENNGLGYSEAFFEDKMDAVIKELEEKNLLKESEGAKLVFFEPFGSAQGKYPPLMILKQDGATLYATRDLATDKFRLDKYGKDIVIVNEVGAEQSLYFKQLFTLEKMLAWFKEGQRIHIKHGHYRFKDKKMSTRKGNVIWLEDILQEAGKRALALSSEKDEAVSEKVAIGAIKWNDLKRNSEQDIVFDWDDILNMEGNSGPYLQYAFARTQSVLAKIKYQISNIKNAYQNLKLENEETSLLRALNRFPEVMENSAGKFAPNILCNYLFDLAQKFNLFYQRHRIIGAIRDVGGIRVALTAAVGQVLKNGLSLLGIQAPNRM